jgi:type I restriction enzyme M protein
MVDLYRRFCAGYRQGGTAMAAGGSLITTLPDGKICDFIDQKIRNDTPEEYVRQNIERRLVLELGFTPEQIEVEFKIKIGSQSKRVDLALFRSDAVARSQDNIWIIIECKRDSVDPKDKNEGVEQLKSYMAASANAEWGMWTNGKFKAVYRKIQTEEGFAYEEPNDIPSSSGDVDEVDRPLREKLVMPPTTTSYFHSGLATITSTSQTACKSSQHSSSY